MTCIVAYRGLSHVSIGCDSRGSNSEGFFDAYQTNKLITLECGAVLGVCGSYKVIQTIREGLNQVGLCQSNPLEIAYAIENLLRHHDLYKEQDWEAVLATQNKVYALDCECTVLEPKSPYVTCGTGEEVAIGALHALLDSDLTPEEMVTRSLLAAHAHLGSVGEPQQVINLGVGTKPNQTKTLV